MDNWKRGELEVETAITGSTCPPDAPAGSVGGCAMTSWARLNGGKWKVQTYGHADFHKELDNSTDQDIIEYFKSSSSNTLRKRNEVLVHPEVVKFIKTNATIVTTPEGNEYMYLPYWFEPWKFKVTDTKAGLNMHSLGKPLPQDLIKFIESEREG